MVHAQRFEWVRTPDAPATFNIPSVEVGSNGIGYAAFDMIPPVLVGGQSLAAQAGSGGRDVGVTKLNADGTPQWSVTFGTLYNDAARDVAVDGDGHAYVMIDAASTSPTIFTTDSTFTLNNQMVLLRVRADGTVTHAAGFQSDNARVAAIRNEVYVIAYNTLYRLDTTLTTIWSRAATVAPQFNGASNGHGDVDVAGDRIAVTGFDVGSGTATFAGLSIPLNGTGYDEMVTAVLDTAGNGLWAHTTDGSNGVLENARAMAIGEDGSVFLGVEASGSFSFAGAAQDNGNGSVTRLGLGKLTSTGAEDWMRLFEPAAGGNLSAVAVNSAGEAAMAGTHGNGGVFGGLTAPSSGGGLFVAKAAEDGTPLWLKDDFGGAINGTVRYSLEEAPGGDLWLGLRDYAPLQLDCFTTNGGGAGSNFIVARISDVVQIIPVAAFSFTDDILTAQFTNASSDAESYSWDFGDGYSSTEQDPEHTYSAAGTYTVILTAIAGTCTDVDSAEVTVINTRVSDLHRQPFALFPNPVGEQLTIQGDQELAAVRLIDPTGRALLEDLGSSPSTRRVVDVSALSKGVYLVQVKFEGGWRSSRVVVE